MIKPLPGVQDVISLLDGVVATRPHLPPLVVVTTSGEIADARGFLEGYRDRLTDVKHRSLVPHAYAGEAAFGMARAHEMPDVSLLDQLASQFRATIPSGAGRRWRTRQFTTCLDVVEAGGAIVVVSARQARTGLLRQLEQEWAKRRPLLSWIHRTAIAAEFPSKLVGLVLSALLAAPSRWWFARRLNGRRLRWFGAQVNKANGLHGDFLDQAVWLLPGGGLPDVTSLRRRILFEALLRDLELFMRRKRFLPHRRRRRWTPVLLLDGTDPLAATLVDLYAELTAGWPVAPLLVISALTPADTAEKAGEPRTAGGAVPVLRSFVNGAALPTPPWLPIRLDEPEDVRAKGWIESHLRVAPRVPGRVSALAPLVATALVVASVAGVVAYRYHSSGCSDTMINAGGERVGVIEGGCSFDYATSTPGVPNLTSLEQDVFANNDAVDRLKDANGDPRYYREVVFFAPLTRPDTQERTAPVNAIWQLDGAVDAQRRHNDDARGNAQLVPIKLVLANSGDRFEDGDWVADRIMARGKSGRGGLAAVIGISQSRRKSRDVVRDRLADVPVISSSMYGSGMRNEKGNMFMSAPLNKAFAASMAEWTGQRGYTGAAVVYDPEDVLFSGELHDVLAARGVGTPATDIEVGEENSKPVSESRLKELCTRADTVVPVFAGRADQIRKVLDAASNVSECASRTDDPIRLLAGPGMIVEAASGNLTKYKWAHVTVTSLGPTAVSSDEGTGADAFRVAAVAIAGACESAEENWDPPLVRTQLEQPDFTVDGFTGPIRLNDETGGGRIRMIDVT
ncbi:hypothetical protein [Umezawaea sp. Da 62-37]|uniref:hypothetical protein n=1 Tax=Umezawaea sp. Da 62-37 TaxID=3075927 RepID=UPI0028F6FD2B|nr:hypothetical protein [Umezawaea sp. Da 62-37]WNV89169.1 hypothetical protein RM788_12960 [Umezawaea sp. Da 62-37]